MAVLIQNNDPRPTVGILGAYGGVGRAVAHQLARMGVEHLVLGGRDRDRLEGLGLPAATSCRVVDADDPRSVTAFLRDCDVVVNCTHGHTPALYRSAIAVGCHLVETGFFPADVFGNAPRLHELGIAHVLGTGWLPGLPEVLEQYALQVGGHVLEGPCRSRGTVLTRFEFDGLGLHDIVGEFGSARGDARTHSVPAGWRIVERVRRLFRPNRPLRLGHTHLPAPIGSGLRLLTPYPVPGKGPSTTLSWAIDLDLLSTCLRLRWHGVRADRTWAIENVLRPGMSKPVRRRGAAGVVQLEVVDAHGARYGVDMVETRHDGYWLTAMAPATAAYMLLRGTLETSGCHLLTDAIDPIAFVHEMVGAGLRLVEGPGDVRRPTADIHAPRPQAAVTPAHALAG